MARWILRVIYSTWKNGTKHLFQAIWYWAPVSSVPSTLRASSIEEPIYSYIPETNRESYPTDEKGVDVMAIDNLPNELPRDASLAFGEKFILGVLPDLLIGNTPKIEKATIARKGSLMPSFSYLEDYIKD